ncbi:hypothetical protein DAPPUDRAFT_306757 [Daphnia pulex]|uniref:Uncharacterized protein n=1 Tax=Daphnia pulex TaxID=6669 RepID=E9GYJ5_DAPPU|nr:hypothetical protein DAPPUDRAFT_306757 [Daphnia pulex]|eukprot:EFX75405.1 hypothetical protein DAPPUDRAFT_306757 [Daphnia pulex]
MAVRRAKSFYRSNKRLDLIQPPVSNRPPEVWARFRLNDSAPQMTTWNLNEKMASILLPVQTRCLQKLSLSRFRPSILNSQTEQIHKCSF